MYNTDARNGDRIPISLAKRLIPSQLSWKIEMNKILKLIVAGMKLEINVSNAAEGLVLPNSGPIPQNPSDNAGLGIRIRSKLNTDPGCNAGPRNRTASPIGMRNFLMISLRFAFNDHRPRPQRNSMNSDSFFQI